VKRRVRIVLTFACGLLAAVLATQSLGADSPWAWTIALVAAFATGLAILR